MYFSRRVIPKVLTLVGQSNVLDAALDLRWRMMEHCMMRFAAAELDASSQLY